MDDLKILLNDISKIYQLSYYKLYYKNLEQKTKLKSVIVIFKIFIIDTTVII